MTVCMAVLLNEWTTDLVGSNDLKICAHVYRFVLVVYLDVMVLELARGSKMSFIKFTLLYNYTNANLSPRNIRGDPSPPRL